MYISNFQEIPSDEEFTDSMSRELHRRFDLPDRDRRDAGCYKRPEISTGARIAADLLFGITMIAALCGMTYGGLWLVLH